ncbi:MAG TPA: peptidoglycan bridge formation glycyltransferase FemA/FemB family protein, partial [Pyrinomonadaceae bacterium]
QLVLYRCDDKNGELVSVLGWVVLGRRAWAVLWATNEAGLSIRQWLKPDVEEVLAVYGSMEKLKSLEEQQSREEVEQLLKHFEQQLVLYRCDDKDGELVSLLGWVVFGRRAWAVLWATNEAGRKLQASHAIFWAVVQQCRKLKVESCDLAGIDPVRNHGVYRFKRDTGAVPLEYLGEWDWASHSWMRWLGNWAIAKRGQFKQTETRLKKSQPASKVQSPVSKVQLPDLSPKSNIQCPTSADIPGVT